MHQKRERSGIIITKVDKKEFEPISRDRALIVISKEVIIIPKESKQNWDNREIYYPQLELLLNGKASSKTTEVKIVFLNDFKKPLRSLVKRRARVSVCSL